MARKVSHMVISKGKGFFVDGDQYKNATEIRILPYTAVIEYLTVQDGKPLYRTEEFTFDRLEIVSDMHNKSIKERIGEE